ncbi:MULTISPECIES: hypothetical protein [unclassified Sporosarcina]|uniref:hypothetical protein n=1 Tax=unclassified Sporosarcina TaxID=2647733 RepID=UPI000C167784|nr:MULTISPECIES: hypothetical protein [unclassified Sporosarcina]PID04686.1 hypothetical protein CSV66_13510 [Sporosarcina sp. P30]PID08079.1 hypothetical protein CSV65_12450 [Sporosarcina sp. P31]PID11026.1 hypothetical protein CSV64_13745 [Sporosarcina sp. P32b]
MDSNFSVEISMTDNGLDFIKCSLKEMEEADELSIKYAVLHLSAGLELILKSRLQKEHWSFLFEDINKANYQNYVSGEFKSVSFENLLSRLVNICQIEISDRTKKRLQNLKMHRNKMEHYNLNIHIMALEATTFEVLSFLIPFIHREELVSRDSELLNYINNKLLQMDSYITQRYKEITSMLKEVSDNIKLLDCPYCMQKETLRLDEAYCYFCNTHFRNLARELIPKFTNEQDVFTYKEFNKIKCCPYCFKNSMIVALEECVCLSCLRVIEPSDYVECGDCLITHVVGDEEGEYYGEEYLCYHCLFKYD